MTHVITMPTIARVWRYEDIGEESALRHEMWCPITMALASVCALFGFLFSIYCSFALCVPPEKIQPVPTQYLGRWSFLTFQTNARHAISA